MILALAGGVGGAKLAKGLADILAPGELTIAVNTGDDFVHLGLHVSPDLDTVMYTLAGINNPTQGWGIAGETWNFMQALEAIGGETWFNLGDRDLATNVERTHRLAAGETLSAVTERLCTRLNVQHRVVPMSDEPVRTLVHTQAGVLPFQDYFVRLRSEPVVTRLEFAGAQTACMSTGLRTALDRSTLTAIVICPSNPYLSVAPILALPGMREALEQRRVPVIAVSPIVAGKALKGPAAKIMRELGSEPSSLEIARYYHRLIDALVIDRTDAALVDPIGALGIHPLVSNTIMTEPEHRIDLAKYIVDSVDAVGAQTANRARI